MEQTRLLALVVACATALLLCSGGPGEATPASMGLGFASSLGIGATARLDPAAALFANPSLLTGLDQRETWMSGSLGADAGALRFALASPFLSGPALALGYGAEAGTSTFSLGAARTSPGHMAWGARLDLLARNEGHQASTDFDLDLGWHWSPLSPLDAGVALSNAVGSVEPRQLRLALAWTQEIGDRWSLGATTGLGTEDGARRQASWAASLRRWEAELAVGAHAGTMRFGAAFDGGPWRLGYAYSEDDEGTHELALQVRLGPSLETRRRTARRAQELETASRALQQTNQIDSARLVSWRAAAAAAATQRDFEGALGYYAAVLALRPLDPVAMQGMRRTRHDAWLEMADRLLQQQNDGAAALALEQALQIVPEDSVTASRLQELRHAALDADRLRDKTARLFDTGLLAYTQQRHLDAVRAFDEVLRLDPQHPTAATYRQQAQHAHDVSVTGALGSARQSLRGGDYEAAQSHVRRVLATEPRHREARDLLVQIDRQARQVREREARDAAPLQVVAAAEDASPRVPSFVAARYEEGLQLYRASDLVGAMRAWEEVARVAPGYQEVSKYLLRVYRVTGLESYTEGRLREAVDIWEKGRSLEPDNEQLRRYLDQAYAKLSRTQTEATGH